MSRLTLKQCPVCGIRFWVRRSTDHCPGAFRDISGALRHAPTETEEKR